jgi:hypothetical protein
MTHNVSISVPMTYAALSSAAKMLSKLADDVRPEETGPTGSPCENTEPKVTVTLKDISAATALANFAPEAKQVFSAAEVYTEPEELDAAEPTGELDANGFPWDERIHSGSKTKDVKGFWKYLRGVDRDRLVPAVEAELMATYGEPLDDVPETTPVLATPPPPPAAASNVTTFAQLITGLTSKSVDEIRVNAVLANVGVRNLALLGARPDLIPEVARQLGL